MLGCAVELLLDALGALVHDLARRDRVAARLARVRDLEQPRHEVRSLLRGLRFDLHLGQRLVGADPLLVGEECGYRRKHGQRGERGEDSPP